MIKNIKRVGVLVIVAFLIAMISSLDVMASTGVYLKPGSFDGDAPSKASKMVNKFAQNIVAIIRVVGVTIAFVILFVIAMKYMTAAPGEKADIKKYAVNYVIAAVILFGATGLISIIYSLSTEIKPS